MTLKLPKIIGHRGCKGYAPENTVTAIHTAADMGIKWIELDVKLTKDGTPIIFHDDSLERTTNGTGAVKDHTWDQLKELDAGIWFSESFYDTPIPSLEQALDAIIERNLGLNLEIKPCEGREAETAEIALDIISRVWEDPSNLLITSFDIECIEVTADYAEDLPRGLLLKEPLKEWEKLAEHLEISAINIGDQEELLNEFTIRQFKNKGLSVCAWTINDEAQGYQLLDWGVDGLITDVPDIFDIED